MHTIHRTYRIIHALSGKFIIEKDGFRIMTTSTLEEAKEVIDSLLD